jgi:hypothetical protein
MAGTGGTDFAHDNSNNAANITDAIPRMIPRVMKISL